MATIKDKPRGRKAHPMEDKKRKKSIKKEIEMGKSVGNLEKVVGGDWPIVKHRKRVLEVRGKKRGEATKKRVSQSSRSRSTD